MRKNLFLAFLVIFFAVRAEVPSTVDDVPVRSVMLPIEPELNNMMAENQLLLHVDIFLLSEYLETDTDSTGFTGKVHVFEANHENGQWDKTTILEGTSFGFGSRIAMDRFGGWLVASSWTSECSNCEGISIYRFRGSELDHFKEIVSSESNFGQAVAVRGKRLLVSSDKAVHLYEYKDGEWRDTRSWQNGIQTKGCQEDSFSYVPSEADSEATEGFGDISLTDDSFLVGLRTRGCSKAMILHERGRNNWITETHFVHTIYESDPGIDHGVIDPIVDIDTTTGDVLIACKYCDTPLSLTVFNKEDTNGNLRWQTNVIVTPGADSFRRVPPAFRKREKQLIAVEAGELLMVESIPSMVFNGAYVKQSNGTWLLNTRIVLEGSVPIRDISLDSNHLVATMSNFNLEGLEFFALVYYNFTLSDEQAENITVGSIQDFIPEDTGLTTAQIIGIVTGSLVAVMIVLAIILMTRRQITKPVYY